ncbi:sensor domain-containing diguanylate cyclase [Dokdonella immobilis]|uniref:PAS domain S-box-containing protein/diguanylate cyclase (GGDEF) domain-containing protein n=1 Tax=Dokdonella immobilis TaxID=578942 RepID=A0A1I4Y5G2_9GAMM|nr:sensor domain-containing diguanylate cyclase [Dokdonella immobilis]SFN33286.1 PAS domain S-box-containing protein/diguanylate cyclase (GGDEF) domain-containing protein [Dokdonella immobilis]
MQEKAEQAKSGPSRIGQMLARLGGADPDLRFRAEVVLGVGAMQIPIIGLLCVTELLWGTKLVGIVCLIGLAALLAILFDLVRSAEVVRAGVRFMTVLFVVSAILNLASGGRTVGVSIALPTLVLIGALVLSRRAAIVLFVMVVLQLGMVGVINPDSAMFPIRPDPDWVRTSIFRVPMLISVGTAFIGLLVRRAMLRHRMNLGRAQAELAANERKLREVFDFSRGLICTHSLDGTVLTANPAVAQSLGYTVEDLVGRNIRELMPEPTRARFAEYLERVAANGGDMGPMQVIARDGSLRFWEYNNHFCRDAAGTPYILGNATDMTERRKLERQLRELSVRDPLTGCFNRRHLELAIERFEPSQRWGCIVVDLDNFKRINDTRGHRVGDEMLIAIGRFLNRHARAGDSVIRMGGDEFLLLLVDGDVATATVAERLRHEARTQAPCDLSIGFAERIGDESLERTLERADRHLYQVRSETRVQERRDAAPDC